MESVPYEIKTGFPCACDCVVVHQDHLSEELKRKIKSDKAVGLYKLEYHNDNDILLFVAKENVKPLTELLVGG